MIDLRYIVRDGVRILQFRGMTLGKWGAWRDVREEVESTHVGTSGEVAGGDTAPVEPKKKKKKK